MANYKELDARVELCATYLASGEDDDILFALEWLAEEELPLELIVKHNISSIIEENFDISHGAVQAAIMTIESVKEREGFYKKKAVQPSSCTSDNGTPVCRRINMKQFARPVNLNERWGLLDNVAENPESKK